MISALAITYNEESNIESYIESLSFADEIVIVDSFSTDNTVALAKKHNVTVVQRPFDNFSNQKNHAISLAKNDWIVFFDLDEKISDVLANEIVSKVNSKNPLKAYKVKRNFIFMGKRLKYSGFQTDEVIRLFHKDYCKYNGNAVHETIVTSEKVGLLKNTSDHNTYKGFDAYNQKLSQYSKLQAQQLFQKNLRPNLYHFLFRPWYRFMHQYFLRLGILDGKEGFILAYINAFSVFKRYIQLWLMYRKID
ncbi:MAG: glycosyl transferase family 2 [Xanthomarina sp.]|uniref:glycosyltransferase family 2 protein n=1 Tax=Xanthomarina sp. TaxID=1931211 RepID=UPI000C43A640|nr:glycosyltransferase family 2 protein [Xanthomarina sp.]MAL22846.1 glycosyl transferase family 2 [Xanthomarina sp.]MBF61613.1 glycosyl transferase family 2 [Xanthomarina sp.]HAB26349.1 glycosyl transferase family 2 [Xanthomarina gelatinilytica]|tara:strand:+ start:869 stop:1615 length:747 start_codon:yes stop_codon:yes gene_type:complete